MPHIRVLRALLLRFWPRRDTLERALKSLVNLDLRLEDDVWDSVTRLISSTAHLPAEEWPKSYKEWSQSLFAQTVDDTEYIKFQRLFGKFLSSGGWEKALLAAQRRPEDYKPWLVVVSGISGIRKKHSVMQPWFRVLIEEAIGRTREWATAQKNNVTEQPYFLTMKPELEPPSLYELCADPTPPLNCSLPPPLPIPQSWRSLTARR